MIARGSHLQHFINGMQTVDVYDEVESKRLKSGIVALQLHAGQPMTVQFKDVRIKSLSSADEVAAANVRIANGFKIDMLYSVPRQTQGSWVALCTDPQGRLIAADQSGKLYRMTLPAPDHSGSIHPEPIGVSLAGAHGLLYAFDSLYAMVNERGPTASIAFATPTATTAMTTSSFCAKSGAAASTACIRSSFHRTASRSTWSAATRPS